ncbi:MAG: phosphatidylglycerophosphatase A [Calditrichaeota bacterium]|nr:MAG: phosphatidylglycerophosphatase A [Calditrichota bacterium]
MRKAALFLGTAFGSGYSPVAPGTVGSMLAVVVLWFLPEMSIKYWVHVIIVMFFIGVWAATECEKVWGHDAGRINWDEVVGMMISLLTLPKTGWTFLAAFILFRFFDIVKPFPVYQAQGLPKGWGVMADDVIAGLYSLLVMRLILWVM